MKSQERSSEPILNEDKSNLATQKKFSFKQLWNMNFGLMGIQFSWGLQMANMSPIFEYLGADARQIPILWIAAPLTGLIVQPIIGNLSDYTWTPLGRRRPYFLAGAIFAATALVLMPYSSSLLMATGLMWLLDSSANASMVPFRAFVGDLLPKEQRTKGFAIQSVMVGIGAVLASALPWLLNHLFAVDNTTDSVRAIPRTIEISFFIGAALFLITVSWTVITTPEYPPQDLEKFAVLQKKRGGIGSSIRESWSALQDMPPIMIQLAKVQFFTWLGVFCFFLYFPTAVAHNIFGAVSQDSVLYSDGIEWAGLCFAVFNAVSILFSFVLPYLGQKIGRQTTHCICLAIGGFSLISPLIIADQYFLLLAMVGFGVAWSSIYTMPYAMLTRAIPPHRRGIYQGIFNFFIVLPEILVSLCFGWIMAYFLGSDRLLAVVLGGIFLFIGAGLTLLVESPTTLESAINEELPVS